MSKFVGQPKHAFDLRHQKKVAQKLDALLNGIIIDESGKVIGRILYAEGNTVWQMSGSGSSITTQIRGEYYSGAEYEVGDMVVVSSGANRGTYVCVKDDPGASNSPWLGGGYWIRLPSENALGQWM